METMVSCLVSYRTVRFRQYLIKENKRFKYYGTVRYRTVLVFHLCKYFFMIKRLSAASLIT